MKNRRAELRTKRPERDPGSAYDSGADRDDDDGDDSGDDDVYADICTVASQRHLLSSVDTALDHWEALVSAGGRCRCVATTIDCLSVVISIYRLADQVGPVYLLSKSHFAVPTRRRPSGRIYCFTEINIFITSIVVSYPVIS